MTDVITLLRCRAPLTLAKRINPGNAPGEYTYQASDKAAVFDMAVRDVSDLTALYHLLCGLADRPDMAVISEVPAGGERLVADVRKVSAARHGDDRTVLPVDHHWFAIDVDSLEPPEGLVFREDPITCVEWVISELGAEFADAAYIWQATGSAGFKPGIRARVWFWLDRRLSALQLQAICKALPVKLDASMYDSGRLYYTAAPVLGDGVSNPMPERIGFVDGRELCADDLLALAGPIVPKAAPRAAGSAVPDISGLHEIARKALVDAAERVLQLGCKRIRKLKEDALWNNTMNEVSFHVGQVSWLVRGGPARCKKALEQAVVDRNDPTFDAAAFEIADRVVDEGAACPEMPSGLRGVENARFVVREGAEPGRALMGSLAGYMAEYDLELFVRGGALVRVANGLIRELSAVSVHEHLESYVRVEKRTPRGEEWVTSLVSPPHDWAEKLWARSDWPGMRELRGVVDVPVLRPDGSLLEMPGWDSVTGLWYAPRLSGVQVGRAVTRAQGRAALMKLVDVTRDFPFATGTDRAAALAFALTLAGRAAVDGPTPLFCFDAAVAGTGKGLLVKVLAACAGVEGVALTAWPKAEEEMEKRVTSSLLAGRRLMVLDECARDISSESLRVVTTEPRYDVRTLGRSEVRTVPTDMIVAVCGNNLTPGADMPRRMCRIRMVSAVEHPEGRTGFRYPDVLGEVQGRQAELLSACLTALRAYVLAGRPDVGELPNLSSYGAWARLVRSTLVWLGAGDPMEGLVEALHAESPQESAEGELLTALWAHYEGKRFTVAELVKVSAPDVTEALDALTYSDNRNARGYGAVLRKLKDRIMGGLVLRAAGMTMGKGRWEVVRK